MRVPHEDPDPPAFIYPVDYPKEHGLTFTDFHPVLAATQPHQPASLTPRPHWQVVAENIEDLHTRFASHNAAAHNARCSPPDRSAVLKIYRQALSKLEHVDALDARRIQLEAVMKVSTILDVRTADPADRVFYVTGAFLDPLEPQYASPRLDFYNRGPEMEDDDMFWTGYGRLVEWRKEGWPEKVPSKAIERERMDMEKRERKGRQLLRQSAGKGLLRALEEGKIDWGQEVDALPCRPWA